MQMDQSQRVVPGVPRRSFKSVHSDCLDMCLGNGAAVASVIDSQSNIEVDGLLDTLCLARLIRSCHTLQSDSISPLGRNSRLWHHRTRAQNISRSQKHENDDPMKLLTCFPSANKYRKRPGSRRK